MNINNAQYLIPNVGSVPSQPVGGEARKGGDAGKPGEFGQILERQIGTPGSLPGGLPGNLKEPLKFSSHASQRIQERKIGMDQKLMSKISEAVDKAESKGLDEALILTEQGAFIVGVKNRTVITALDKGSMNGNVFTNIDGAVIA